MEESSRRDEDHWSQVTSSLDLLFARVSEIGASQKELRARLDLTTESMDLYAREQQMIVKQVEATGQAVARLTMDMMSDGSDTDAASEHPPHHPRFQRSRPPPRGESSHTRPPGFSARTARDTHTLPRSAIPKMQFPQFTGAHPKIWRDKCLTYFQISNIDESMWITTASLQ